MNCSRNEALVPRSGTFGVPAGRGLLPSGLPRRRESAPGLAPAQQAAALQGPQPALAVGWAHEIRTKFRAGPRTSGRARFRRRRTREHHRRSPRRTPAAPPEPGCALPPTPEVSDHAGRSGRRRFRRAETALGCQSSISSRQNNLSWPDPVEATLRWPSEALPWTVSRSADRRRPRIPGCGADRPCPPSAAPLPAVE